MRLGWVCVLGLAMLLGGRARAEAPLPVLVLPTQLGGGVPDRPAWQKLFDDRVEATVRRSGRTPRPSGPLTSAESSCRDARCLARLAEAAGVEMVILGRVVADRGTPPSYRLSLLRFDRDRPGSLRQEDAECSVCSAEEAAERLERMVTQTLPPLVVLPPKPVVPDSVPLVAPAAAPVQVVTAAPRRSLPKAALYGLVGATAAFGVGGVVLLGLGGRGIAIDGEAASPPVSATIPSALIYDTRGSGIAMVASGTVLLIGAAVGLGFEVMALRRRAR